MHFPGSANKKEKKHKKDKAPPTDSEEHLSEHVLFKKNTTRVTTISHITLKLTCLLQDSHDKEDKEDKEPVEKTDPSARTLD